MSDSLSRMKALVTGYPVTEGSFLHDAFAPVASEVDALTDETLPAALDACMPDTALDSDLDRVAAAYGVTRKPGACAVGQVTFTGTPGTVIGANVPVSTVAGFVFLVDAQATIPAGGAITVNVTAMLFGSKGNLAAGTVTVVPVSVAGVDSVTNSADMTGGADIESDADFRERLLQKIQLPSASGIASDYVRWAREVQGVDDARCAGLWNGPGTVKVIIAGAGMQPADAATRTRCADYLETVRPIGAQITVVSVTSVVVNITATLTLATGYTLAAVKTAFEAALQAYFQDQAFSVNYLSIAKVGALLLSVDGVLDYTLLKLNGAASNVALTDEQVPTLGTVTLS
jgi:uncharacterized phage protein gp47/JayE